VRELNAALLDATEARGEARAAMPFTLGTVELTMSHVGLGSLTESALMVLFGNAHSHRLVAGTGRKPDGLVDHHGNRLYPAYFATSLIVPVGDLLSSYKLWEHVDIGIDVRRFGETLLESTYVLGRQGGIGPEMPDWHAPPSPMMTGCNLMVVDAVDGTGLANRQVAVPRSECLAPLPKMRSVPAAVARSKLVRNQGFRLEPAGIALRTDEPIRYMVRPGADAAPGHAMVFAKFSDIMDVAEREFLARHARFALPAQALDHLSVIERTTYYYGNCFGGESLNIRMSGFIRPLDWTKFNESSNCILAAELNLEFEISKVIDGSLVAMACVKKLLVLPAKGQDVARDVARILSRA
jgi:probable biosynthetic protein (TIGR04098 family)